jgi:anti-sigma B factor antagonist
MAMDERLTISTSADGGTTTLSLDGELDPSSAPDLATAIGEALGRDDLEAVVIDVRDLAFIDSSGLSVLVNGHADAVGAGVGFSVANPTSLCERLIAATGLADLLASPAP